MILFCRNVYSASKLKLLQYFLETCTTYSSSTATIAGTHKLNYQQLQKAAVQIQSILQDVGVKRSQIVSICIPRSAALVAAVLGCILHGAVFLLVDPSVPAQRIKVQFEISRPRVLLYSMQDHLKVEPIICACKAPVHGIGVQMEEDCITFPLMFSSSQNAAENITCDDDVFCIAFTSGSTGIPKAVCVSASVTLNRFEWMWNEFPFQSSDVVCFKTSVSFVVSVWEVLGTVLKGATLAIPLEEEAKDPPLLLAFMKKWKVTRVVFVPSYLRHVLECTAASECLQFLTHCISCGEILTTSLAEVLLKAVPTCMFLNSFGTSEIWDVVYFKVTSQYLEHTNSSSVPIGKPIPNVDIAVLDPDTGAVISPNSSKEGELVKYGSSVTRLYLNSDEKSSIFNTHDLVHYNSSGDLMYIGRRDHQVKVRGVRVNPSEIEALLEKNSIVQRAVVIADESHMNLIGFIQIGENYHPSKESSAGIKYGGAHFFINSFCSEAVSTEILLLLPQYMVPSMYVCTYRLPTLPSGKINRKVLLPSSEIKKMFSESVLESVQLSKTEEQLCCIFCKVLKLTNVPQPGNFFALGGNSLSAIYLASSIQECFHCEVSVATIVANHTIQSLALVIDKNAANMEPEPISNALQQAYIDYTGPISYRQEWMWCYEAMASFPFNSVGAAAMCLTPINVDILQTAIHNLITKHESLRTIYCLSKHGHPYQKVIKCESSAFNFLLASAFVVKDCSPGCPLGFNDTQIILPSLAFNLVHGPLWRITMFINVAIPGERENCSVIAFQAHHMMTDGWSIQVLTSELEEVYMRLSNGEANVLLAPNPSTSLSAIKQAIAERSKSIDKELRLWSTKFHNALLPPFFHPKCLFTCTNRAYSASVINKQFVLSMQDIRSFSQANGMSEFIPVCTSLLTAIYALSGNTDVLAFIMHSIRNSDNAKVSGLNADSFPLRTTFDGNTTLYSLLSTVQAGILEVMENRISLYQLEKALVKRGRFFPESLFSSGILKQLDIIFNYKSSVPFSDSKLFKKILINQSACECLMEAYIDADSDELDVHIVYAKTLYSAETVQLLLDTWERVLVTMVKHVYLNVPLKRLFSDICMFSQVEATKTQENDPICYNMFQSNSGTDIIAVSLNAADDVVTWVQFSLIQKSLMHFMSSYGTVSGKNRPIVLAHLPFSAFVIALIAAATRLEYSFVFCSSLEGIVAKMVEASRYGSSYLVVVNNVAESKQIKKCYAIEGSVVTIESFNLISLPRVSSAPLTDFTVDYTKWRSDLLTSLSVLSTYLAGAKMHKAITLTSPGSSTFAIAVNLLLHGIQVQAYTIEHTASFVEACNEIGVDMILIQEIAVPSILPKIVRCKVKLLWIQGLPLGLAYISKWMAASQHVRVIVAHSLVHEQHLITHHLNLKDIPSIEDGSIPCIPIGRMCQGLNGKVLHRDGREVYQGFVGNFATVNGSQVHRSTYLVRQLHKDSSFELVSVNSDAYYKAMDTTPPLFVLSTIPEVSWCGISQGYGKESAVVVYSTHVDTSERAHLHNKITQLLISTLSIAYAGLVHQLFEPPPNTSENFSSDSQNIVTNVPYLHWLYSDPALTNLNNHVLPDKMVELVSKSFDTDPDTVRQTCDLMCIGGMSTASILSLTVALNAAFNASFTIPAVSQALHDGRLISLVVET